MVAGNEKGFTIAKGGGAVVWFSFHDDAEPAGLRAPGLQVGPPVGHEPGARCKVGFEGSNGASAHSARSRRSTEKSVHLTYGSEGLCKPEVNGLAADCAVINADGSMVYPRASASP